MKMAGIDFPKEKTKTYTGLPIPMGIFIVLFLGAVILTLFLTLPIIALFSSFRLPDFFSALTSPYFSQSLLLSIVTTFISTAIIFLLGTPLAYVISRVSFKGKELAALLIDLPIVIPPSVAGVGLLLVFGRRGLLGEWLYEWGISLSFSTAAVILAQIFISAPFFIRSAKSGFANVSVELEAMSRSLGAGWLRTFIRVTLPLAKPFLISGIMMSWARALGEFGATIMFAGNFIGKTETLPLAIYSAMNDDLGTAIVLANLLLVISLLLMIMVRLFTVKE